MKTILIFVTSLDGKITRWGDPSIRQWSSHSDQEYFDAVWKSARVIIMGSGTYKPAPIKPDPHHLFIVLTRKPMHYSDKHVHGQLEFTDESFVDLLDRFRQTGEESVLIVGGAKIATAFLKEKLIDELWITIEPRIFGSGSGFVVDEKLDIQLNLISCIKANDRGTLFTKYRVSEK
jgi:dihydrofolate reductase